MGQWCIGDYIYCSRIIVKHCKVPYQTTSIMESKSFLFFFFMAQVVWGICLLQKCMVVLIRNRDVFDLCQGQHPYLDYYIYSSFTENPSNQCLIHSKQDCMNCLNSCVDAFAGGSCCDVWWCFWNPTWRIIPFSKWLITMVSKSPTWGCSPSKWRIKGSENGGVTTYLPTGMILQVCESVLCYCCLL